MLKVVLSKQERHYATTKLEESGRQNDEKMSRKTGNAQSRATVFRHSAVLSLPAVLLFKQGWTLNLRALAIRASNPQNALARISFHSPKSLPPPRSLQPF